MTTRLELSSSTSTISMAEIEEQTNNNMSSRRNSLFNPDYCKELYVPSKDNIKDESCVDGVHVFPKTHSLASLNEKPPKDKWKALLIILLIQGLATTLPWNMFINAQSYFQDYKLKTTPNSTDMERHYQSSFMSYVTICSMIPSVLLSAINVFITKSKMASPMRMIVAKLVIIILLAVTVALAAIDTSEYVVTFFIVTMVIIVFTNGTQNPTLQRVMSVFIIFFRMASPMRMIVAKLVIIILLAVTVALAAIDTSEYVVTFFIVTMVIIVFTNGASAIYSNSLFGVCSILPSRFITTVIYGTNSAGVLTSISSIISIAISPNAKTSALFYFSSAIFVVIIALITNKIFQRLPLYVHCTTNITNKADKPEKQSPRPQLWKIFKKIWSVCFNIWLTFTITIVNFPNVVSQVERKTIPIDDSYWTPVFCFLNFNIFNLMGSIPVHWTVWPGPKRMWIVVLIRTLILGPFFILNNYLPDERVMPAYLANDYAFIFAVSILGFTNAYLMNCYFIYTPSLLDADDVAVGGMIVNIFLFLGILSGGLIAFVTHPLVKYSW